MGRSNRIGYKVRLIQNQIHKNMEAKRMQNEGDLTGMQRWTIGFLSAHREQCIYQKDLETEFSVSRATVSNMLAVMERKGLIERVSVAHDARLKKIILTEKAERMLKQAEEDICRQEEQLINGMTEKEVEQLHELLDKLLLNLGIDEESEHRACRTGNNRK